MEIKDILKGLSIISIGLYLFIAIIDREANLILYFLPLIPLAIGFLLFSSHFTQKIWDKKSIIPKAILIVAYLGLIIGSIILGVVIAGRAYIGMGV